MIPELYQRCKQFVTTQERSLSHALMLMLGVLLLFGLVRFSQIQAKQVPVVIEQVSGGLGEASGGQTITPGMVVASNTGKKYYLPWCSGALKITKEKQRWFASVATAEAAGYTPAANCKGL